MNDETNKTHNEHIAVVNTPESSAADRSRIGAIIAFGLALVYMMVSGYLLSNISGRISNLEQNQVAIQQKADQKNAALESNLKSTADALASQVGMTQEDLAKKTSALQQSQRAAVSRLSEEQKDALNGVNTEVSGVKGDLDATKAEVATTKTGLEATNARLDTAIGDLGVQSGLIAHSRDELEMLKHRGDRAYHEFTLVRGKPPIRVSTVSLQLKKVDPKKNRFTLDVLAEDKVVEKKDRNTEEPLQFYTGKDHQSLYEVVVFTVTKNQVTGYLSTPQQATQSASLPGAD
jgi:hypothetical protein